MIRGRLERDEPQRGGGSDDAELPMEGEDPPENCCELPPGIEKPPENCCEFWEDSEGKLIAEDVPDEFREPPPANEEDAEDAVACAQLEGHISSVVQKPPNSGQQNVCDLHDALQASLLLKLPSSHSSVASTIPLPHILGPPIPPGPSCAVRPPPLNRQPETIAIPRSKVPVAQNRGLARMVSRSVSWPARAAYRRPGSGYCCSLTALWYAFYDP